MGKREGGSPRPIQNENKDGQYSDSEGVYQGVMAYIDSETRNFFDISLPRVGKLIQSLDYRCDLG